HPRKDREIEARPQARKVRPGGECFRDDRLPGEGEGSAVRPRVDDHGEDGGGDDTEKEARAHTTRLEPQHEEEAEERDGHGSGRERAESHGYSGRARLDDARLVETDEEDEEPDAHAD